MNRKYNQSQIKQISAKISQLMREFRKPLWELPLQGSLREPVIYFEEANVEGKPYKVPLFILRTKPCFWLQSGGCSMCNYHIASALNHNVSTNNLYDQFSQVLNFVKGKQLPYILLTSSGSFLDDREVPEAVRLSMLRQLADAELTSLTFECRAEFLTDKTKLLHLIEAFKGGNLNVGIGLESSDSFIRNTILHKGLSDRTLEKACNTLTKAGIAYYFYVMAGKPFLTIQEDIDDTIDTIKTAFGYGGFMAVLETVNIQPHTLTKYLYDRKEYTPPSLWLATEVLEQIDLEHRKMIPVKGYEKAAPMPQAFSSTCPSCNEQMRHALRDWNLHRDWQNFCDLVPDCSCRDAFHNAAKQCHNHSPINERLEPLLDRLLKKIQ